MKEDYNNKDILCTSDMNAFGREESLYSGAAYHDRKGRSYFK